MTKPHDFVLNGAKPCGAKGKRSGKPCRCPAMPNGRCRLHGGKSTGRPITHGQRTKKAITQRKEAAQIRRTMKELMETALADLVSTEGR